ncbi:6-hydroxynicotinate 3-monooxygenase-like isoform X2 [Rhodamnia argentea]|uniref:6-hydroxynicotinate 3-monooxygenase-like isoform X2 n=1 Tax=Rhodamnia argentea TaxID=178133 RepID=A0A8B8Q7P2_9MYRT|nr:6-hydroxynicotinate 3-monooxygenase-like isoform X2 [Rhodamnia argentea]
MEGRDEETKETTKPKAKAVIVGGSIAGLSCAHALILAGWDVVVVEKSSAPPTGSPTGAGLGLEPSARKLIEAWLGRAEQLQDATLPLAVDQNNATDSEKNVSWVITRDEEFDFRAAHWTNLHGLLREELPPTVMLYGHVFLSFSLSNDKTEVRVKTKVLKTNDTIEITGNLLVAADGCLSSIRQSFLPNLKLRYSGYCAWRGVLDFSGRENSEAILGIKRAYPDLGKCLYFDLGSGTHSVLYELLNRRLNWIWYINQPEPELKGNSLTMKVSSEMIQKMHREAEKVWLPELARIMKETKEPFINVIYDCDPLERVFWDNVVLVGDAAHPTTPHGLRSTNMSISDATVLGLCLKKWGVKNLQSALCEYQSLRLPVTSKQVLHSRRLGRIKQGLPVAGWEQFDPLTTNREEWQELQQKNMPFFNEVLLPENSSI